jgi:hypothetical protein
MMFSGLAMTLKTIASEIFRASICSMACFDIAICFDIRCIPFSNQHILKLLTQHHALLLIQVPEVRIVQIFDKVDSLAGRFHLGAQFA